MLKTPLVHPHDEHLDRRLVENSRIYPFEPVVVPSHKFIVILGIWSVRKTRWIEDEFIILLRCPGLFPCVKGSKNIESSNPRGTLVDWKCDLINLGHTREEMEGLASAIARALPRPKP